MALRVSACIAALLLLVSQGAASEKKNTEVMILGTFHFANPGLDLVNTEIDDVLAPSRQAEIEAVAKALARFKPTKIAVEYPSQLDRQLNIDYRRYRSGTRKLTRNESEQIGLRLAAKLDHERVYAVDEKLDLDFAGTFAAGAENGQERVISRFQRDLAEIKEKFEALQSPEVSIAKSLRFHNEPQALGGDGHSFYVLLSELGTRKNPAGARLLSDWYRRNALIFANVLRIIDVEAPQERVLVIYGSGHRALLVDFVEDHPNLELVSPLEFLPNP